MKGTILLAHTHSGNVLFSAKFPQSLNPGVQRTPASLKMLHVRDKVSHQAGWKNRPALGRL